MMTENVCVYVGASGFCLHTVDLRKICTFSVSLIMCTILELLNLTVWCGAKTKSGWTVIFAKSYGNFEIFLPPLSPHKTPNFTLHQMEREIFVWMYG